MSDYGNGTSTSNKYNSSKNSRHDPAFIPHCIILYLLHLCSVFLHDIFPCVIFFHLERHAINVIHSNLVELSENGKRTSNKYYAFEILCGQQPEIDSTARFHEGALSRIPILDAVFSSAERSHRATVHAARFTISIACFRRYSVGIPCVGRFNVIGKHIAGSQSTISSALAIPLAQPEGAPIPNVEVRREHRDME